MPVIAAPQVRLGAIAARCRGINVRRDNERAGTTSKGRDAARDKPFEISGWTFDEVDGARDHAEELGLDRLILTRLGTIE